ncbi:nuclear transport factor 2 family protein [Candidatus Marinimicrobia bacterium MT.SAG.3]|nr:nuclear transport factor 2 family protein [Candidatus Marinimicrobia bacterium MT.SAG.3]
MKEFILAFLFIGNSSVVYAQDMVSKDVALIKAVVQYYHKALEAKDKETALKLLSDDVLIQESGHLETAEEYKSHHLMSDMEFSAAVSGKREVIEAVTEGNIGWVVSSSSMVGEFRGREINSIGAELIVLLKENGSWKIRAIHWSSRKNE